MPRYQYECQSCGENFEKRQSFSEDPLTDCPLCHAEGTVDRIISSVGVIFKGSGFYINDSKPDKKKTNTQENGKGKDKDKSNGSSDKSSDKSSETSEKSEASSKPADKETSKSKASSS